MSLKTRTYDPGRMVRSIPALDPAINTTTPPVLTFNTPSYMTKVLRKFTEETGDGGTIDSTLEPLVLSPFHGTRIAREETLPAPPGCWVNGL